MARPMPRAPPLTMMFLGGAWNAMFENVMFEIGESWNMDMEELKADVYRGVSL